MVSRRGVAELEWMLDHELLLAERYRRFVSLALIKSDSAAAQRDMLKRTVRSSDIYFELNESLGAVLMSETDSGGAARAVKRFKETCEGLGTVRFAIASYPEDHMPAPKFVSTAYERIKAASRMGDGAVVAST